MNALVTFSLGSISFAIRAAKATWKGIKTVFGYTMGYAYVAVLVSSRLGFKAYRLVASAVWQSFVNRRVSKTHSLVVA